jgi:hypothetical protein
LSSIFPGKIFRRQEAGGRRQKAGGRRQKAGGRRQEVNIYFSPSSHLPTFLDIY